MNQSGSNGQEQTPLLMKSCSPVVGANHWFLANTLGMFKGKEVMTVVFLTLEMTPEEIRRKIREKFNGL